ncbi:TetR/AcrR family transcriptional regulator C-terminal ligand-binding domain-containing protein [Saccharopolyspora pogona]|uniref:TetR/AcrR family transcriptional regulator C-terminal ligand-binding domain-containing protein n=1 Tax=Saccharopolyspora pogona TaxID=333966 RepID=UPI001CC239AF|nr:TetR/AcrR family transcriptional regulator C-terminal ligand-binding domain-containing protein [Saccharopolyspora pogona]
MGAEHEGVRTGEGAEQRAAGSGGLLGSMSTQLPMPGWASWTGWWTQSPVISAASPRLVNWTATCPGGCAGECGAGAVAREEPAPDAEAVLDRVVAPVMYRILFRPTAPTPITPAAWSPASCAHRSRRVSAAEP